MSHVRIEDHAATQIEDIYIYTTRRWNEAQATDYIHGLTAAFADLASGRAVRRRASPALGIAGYVHRYRHHLIYWRPLDDGGVGIFAVLHERQHQIERLRDDP